MSVQLGVDCLDCRMLAPEVGYGGFLGAPVLEPVAESKADGRRMPSFGYFYEALEGMGIRPYDLVVLREFLTAHRGHRLRVSEGDGISGEVVRAALKAQSAEKKRRTASGEFRELVFEVTCTKCDESLKAPRAELLQTAEPSSPSGDAVSNFLKRWSLAPDDGWNYSLVGIADPFDPFMEELLTFLKAHRRHKLLIHLRSSDEGPRQTRGASGTGLPLRRKKK